MDSPYSRDFISLWNGFCRFYVQLECVLSPVMNVLLHLHLSFIPRFNKNAVTYLMM